MGAANLDKMVEKNRDLLECVGGEILEMYVLERRKEMERWLDIGLENLWYRFVIRTGTKGCSRWPPPLTFGTGS